MKIICVGRNYVDHAKELGNQVPAEPVLFLKPDTALVPKRNPFFIPDFSREIHHELELVVRIDKIGKHIQEKFAHKYFNQLTLGIDFTARDLQHALKQKGLPWEKAKAFDGSALIGKWVEKSKFPDLQNLELKLLKNDQLVQKGNSADMLFSIHRIIEEVSKYFTLKIGDLIFTGTPAGVGPVQPQDKLEGFLEDQRLFSINVK